MSQDQGGELAETPPARRRKYSRTEHLTRCHNAHGQAVTASITFGRYLHEMKEELGIKNEEWAELLRDEFDISAGTASKLMTIGKNPVLTDPDFSPGKILPIEWTITYELARMPAPDLRAAIESGLVRPDTSRAEARMIAKGGRPPEQAIAERRDDQADERLTAGPPHRHEFVCRECSVPLPAGARPFSVMSEVISDKTEDDREAAEG